ncbi:YeiH family protein [Thalassospira alkalitolerans]|uniref:YeiH family protein n=1 Tax=Thalassospira alkalitolerans TaxID=1293890 RepID=UPI003AA7C5DF
MSKAYPPNTKIAYWSKDVRKILPGLILSACVAGLAMLTSKSEQLILGATWLEPLVLAIVIGAILRTLWEPHRCFLAGIGFATKTLLEIAIVFLGATVSAQTLLSVGPELLIGIVTVVAMIVPASYFLGRLLGLPTRMAILIACGNGICGNSAIAAVAPTINADSDDVSASITFTAVLGVGVVLGLPLIGKLVGLEAVQYGILSGLTVYAVPQVLATAAPMGTTAIHIGTLVKLVRVMMLGPITVVLSMLAPRLPGKEQVADATTTAKQSLMPPLFILGFLAMIGLRSADAIPQEALSPISTGANVMTVISMAALGLGVDARAVMAAGPRVFATVVLSLIMLIGLGLGIIAFLAM